MNIELRGGGVLSTAGNLVVQGNGKGFLSVYAADTGAKLAASTSARA